MVYPYINQCYGLYYIHFLRLIQDFFHFLNSLTYFCCFNQKHDGFPTTIGTSFVVGKGALRLLLFLSALL